MTSPPPSSCLSCGQGRQVLLLLGLTGVIHVDLAHEGASLGLLEQVDHGVVDGVSVLVEPSSHVLGDTSGIEDHSKVSVLVWGTNVLDGT